MKMQSTMFFVHVDLNRHYTITDCLSFSQLAPGIAGFKLLILLAEIMLI